MRIMKLLPAALLLIACISVSAQQVPGSSPAVAISPSTGNPPGPVTPLTEPVATPALAQPIRSAQPVAKAAPVVAPTLPPQKILMRRVAMIDIPGRPGFDGVGIVGGNLVMTHPAASTVDVFSLAKRRVI